MNEDDEQEEEVEVQTEEPNGWSKRAVDRRRGESLFIIYGARANIKFSNCKIDAAYVTLSVDAAVSSSSVVTPHHSAAASPTTIPRVSRVPSSFYSKTTPHIVQGRVIHFLPDSAQLFINCCSLGADGTDLSSLMRRVAKPSLSDSTASLQCEIKRKEKKTSALEDPYERPVTTRHLQRSLREI